MHGSRNNAFSPASMPEAKSGTGYLARIRLRALELLSGGDTSAAIASMLDGLEKWEGGPIYNAGDLAILGVEVRFYTSTPEEVRDWIESFV